MQLEPNVDKICNQASEIVLSFKDAFCEAAGDPTATCRVALSLAIACLSLSHMEKSKERKRARVERHRRYGAKAEAQSAIELGDQ